MSRSKSSDSLNKRELNPKKKQLPNYQRYLPALELKQQQLMIVQKQEREVLVSITQKKNTLCEFVKKELPMLACDTFRLDKLIELQSWKVDEEYVVGIVLPHLTSVIVERKPYGFLARPHWVDSVVDCLEQAIQLDLEHDIQLQRVDALKKATQSATQRVNLFSKILVPETKQAIKKIQIYVSDSEAAAVVRAKITKKKTKKKEELLTLEGQSSKIDWGDPVSYTTLTLPTQRI